MTWQEKNLTRVESATEFRDIVMTLDREGYGNGRIYVRQVGTDQIYRVIPRHTDPFQKITFSELFLSNHPPIYMEDFAQAMIDGKDRNFLLEVFTR